MKKIGLSLVVLVFSLQTLAQSRPLNPETHVRYKGMEISGDTELGQSPNQDPVPLSFRDVALLLSFHRDLSHLRVSEDLVSITDNAIQSRRNWVDLPENASSSIKHIALSLSYLLGGHVTFKDDADGMFFDANHSEKFLIRPRPESWRFVNPRLKQAEEEIPFESKGGLGYLITYQLLQRIFLTYGLLKDFGIDSLEIEYKKRGKAGIEVKKTKKGVTLVIRIKWKKVKAEPGSVREVFDMRRNPLPPYYRMTNWWKYREYDKRAMLVDNNGLPGFRWRKGVESFIVNAGGSVLGGGGVASQMDPVMSVGPSDRTDIENYYLQVTTPDAGAIEYAIVKSKRERQSAHYTRSFLLEEFIGFANLFFYIQEQQKWLEEQQKHTDDVLSELEINDSEGNPLTRAEKRNALVWMRLSTGFVGKLAKEATREMKRSGSSIFDDVE